MDESNVIEGAGTLTGEPGRYEVRFVRRYERPVDELWAAISTPEGLDAWYPTKLRTDGVIGNRVTETFESPDGSPPEPAPPGFLTAYQPPHLFEYRIEGPDEAPYPGMLGKQTIRMEAGPGAAEDESVLTFTHWVETLPTALDVLSGWHYCLEFLALEMGAPGAPTQESLERYQRYYQQTYGDGAPGPA